MMDVFNRNFESSLRIAWWWLSWIWSITNVVILLFVDMFNFLHSFDCEVWHTYWFSGVASDVDHLQQMHMWAYLKYSHCHICTQKGWNSMWISRKLINEIVWAPFLLGFALLEYFLNEELIERVIKVATINEFADHLQQRLDRRPEDGSQQVNCLQIRLTAHQDFIEIGQQTCSSWKLFKPLLISYLLQVLLKFDLQVFDRELFVSAVKELLELLKAFFLLFLELLLLVEIVYFCDVVDEFLGETNCGEELQLRQELG